ncbi:putative ankyrin repeat protein [Colletotrichum spinosum]|uniref:Putative ankyrin repeat protein n=1 Tax=Colletotrichum spinosum TaxID=1347390 RepID=A0A4R8PW09_9PEZI|nr:putative ankyrin repeat protein [Colletotrichum spinosum]
MANEDGQFDAGPSSLGIDTQGAGNKEKLDKTTLTRPKTPKTPETPSRLRLRSHQPPKIGDQDEIVRVDVIHVTILRSEEEMHSLEELLPEPEDDEEFREYVFTLNLAEVLAGSLTMDLVESQAVNLFQEVHQLATHEEASKCKRIIIWVAYDFGSLLVKLPAAALGAAARRGCFDAVRLLLERGADLNGPPPGESETGGSRWSPLSSACLGGFPRTVEALLKGGADANGPGPGGKYTCLHVSAVITPNVDCVRLLSRYGASKSRGPMLRPLIHNIAWSEYDHETAVRICDALLQTTSTPFEVDENDRYYRTALMVAGDKGNLPLTRWLLERGANVNAMDEDGRRPLHNAIFSGKLEVMMEVLNRMKPSELNEIHKSSKGSFASYLGLAATLENMEAVRILIEKGADINQKNTNGYTPIVFAVRRAGDPAMTRFFVEKGAKLDAETIGVQILHLSLYGPADTLKVLLEFRRYIDIDAKSSDGFTALHIAVLENLKGHVQLLFRAGADINSKDASGDTVLHFALRDKRSDIISMILEAPEVDINCVGERDGSPLQAACLHGDISGVDALLEHGADVNITVTNMLGSTPLMACSLHWGETSHEEDALRKDNLARRLVRMGAEVGQTVPGSRFYTALSAACYGAGTNTINFLLDEGASAQLADPIFGWLPHHFAAGNGVENFRAILHAFRGDMMTADKMGKNCLHWAAQSGNLEATIYGLKYKCQSCPDYDVCSKCISKVGALHTGDTQGDALPHSFSPADEQEFVTPPPSPGPEPAMDKEAVGSETTQELRTSGEYTHDPNDELDELDALDLSLET